MNISSEHQLGAAMAGEKLPLQWNLEYIGSRPAPWHGRALVWKIRQNNSGI
jgi:hypothetical protein